MKRLLYLFALVAFATTMDACKKGTDPEPIPPIVGKWSSDYVLWTGFVAPYTTNNNLQINPALYGIQDAYDIKADKTFILTDRSRAVIQSFPGTWTYTGTDLTLNYDSGDKENLTYDDTTPSKPLLKFPVAMDTDTLVNPTTRKPEAVRHNIQLVYSKQ